MDAGLFGSSRKGKSGARAREVRKAVLLAAFVSTGGQAGGGGGGIRRRRGAGAAASRYRLEVDQGDRTLQQHGYLEGRVDIQVGYYSTAAGCEPQLLRRPCSVLPPTSSLPVLCLLSGEQKRVSFFFLLQYSIALIYGAALQASMPASISVL